MPSLGSCRNEMDRWRATAQDGGPDHRPRESRDSRVEMTILGNVRAAKNDPHLLRAFGYTLKN